MPLKLCVFGTEVSFSFWFFAVVALFVLLGKETLVLYLILPVIIHECGHLLAMLFCRAKIHSIRLTPISVDIRRVDRDVRSHLNELVITLAGIATNMLAALVLRLFFFQSIRVMFLGAANIAVALFNLLPIGNLDGGELCRLICERLFTPRAAWYISHIMSFLVLTPLVALSVLFILRGYNFTLLLTCIYLALTVIFRE